MDWMKIVIVGSGGFIGANLRYWLGGLIQSRLGSAFPWGTMIVNVTGAVAIGAFMYCALRENWHPNWRLFIAIGIFGGYTTYSTFAYESLHLFSERNFDTGMFYALGTATLTILAAWAGRVLAKIIVGG